MPRVEGIAWKFVIRLEKKWCCPYCKQEYSGSVTRVRSHFLKQRKEGIASCTKVPEHTSTLMELLHKNQVHNKEDIAWKFVDRLKDSKWRCHYCSEEFFGDLTGVKVHLLKVPNEGISICTRVLDHVKNLWLSLLDEVAEEESRDAHGQSPLEPQPRDMLPSAVPSQSWRLEAPFTESDRRQGQHQFHQSITMPSPVQNSHDVPPLIQSSELLEETAQEPRAVNITNLPLDGAPSYSSANPPSSFTDEDLTMEYFDFEGYAQQGPGAPLPS